MCNDHEVGMSTDEIRGIGMENVIREIITGIGDCPSRSGVIETPARVVKSWKHLFSGYNTRVSDVFKVFDDSGNYDQMIVLKDIEFYSTCEHHMLPFYGKAHVAYIPGNSGKVVGISKLARVLEVYSRRLQIQERIGQQVTNALDEYLDTAGSACIINARHLCMMARGVEKQNSTMVTSSLTGVFREQAVKAELMSFIGGS